MWLETDNAYVNLEQATAIERDMSADNVPLLIIHFPAGQVRKRTLSSIDEVDEISERLEMVEGLITK